MVDIAITLATGLVLLWVGIILFAMVVDGVGMISNAMWKARHPKPPTQVDEYRNIRDL